MRPGYGGKQALGVLAGLLGALLILLVGAPPLVRAAGAAVRAPRSIRDLNYFTQVDRLRDPETYTLAMNGLPAGHTSLLLLGSSELSANVPQNPVAFLPKKVSDFDLFLAGRGYTQSLYQAIFLAAIGSNVRGSKVALILSPQWFSSGGVSREAFAEVFSQSAYDGMLKSEKLSPGVRSRIVDRVRQLREVPADGSATLPKRVSNQIMTPVTVTMEKARSALATAPFRLPYAASPGAVPAGSINWDEELNAAEQEGRATSHNKFDIEDDYYARYVEPKMGAYQGSLRDLEYAGSSPEYGDLELFLDVASDLGIDVLLISAPMHGRLYDYGGYPKERRAKYYDKIRAIAERRGVKLADFGSHEYESFFLGDAMHLGGKGWLHVMRACIDFAIS